MSKRDSSRPQLVVAICLHHQKPNNRLDKVGEILLLSRHCPCRFFDLRLQLLTSLHHQLSFFLYILNHFLNLRARISQETATSRHECYLRKVTHTFQPKFIADGPHALTLEGRASAVRNHHSPGTKPVHHHRLHRLRFRADSGGGGQFLNAPARQPIFCPIALRPRHHARRLDLCITAPDWLIANLSRAMKG